VRGVRSLEGRHRGRAVGRTAVVAPTSEFCRAEGGARITTEIRAAVLLIAGGEILYGCYEPGHYQAGMVGRVIFEG
jgi:hypothetical protein